MRERRPTAPHLRTLLLTVASVALTAGLWAAQPARAADGLAFLCDDPATPPPADPAAANGGEVGMPQGFAARGHATVEGLGEVATTFPPPPVLFPLVAHTFSWDFDHDGVNDVGISVGPRFTAQQAGPDDIPANLGIGDVLAENFGRPPELLGFHFGLGLDVVFRPAPHVRARLSSLRIEVGVLFRSTTGATAETALAVEERRFGGGGALPERFAVAVLWSGYRDLQHLVVGEHATYPAGEARGQVTSRVALHELDHTNAPRAGRTLFAASLGWLSPIPETFALGVERRCGWGEPSRMQLGWQVKGQPAAGSTLRMTALSGPGGGVAGADEMIFNARVEGTPTRLDMALRRDRADILYPPTETDGSPGVAVGKLTLDRLQLASVGPDPRTPEPPLFLAGEVTDLPPHLRLDTVLGDEHHFAVRARACPSLAGDEWFAFRHEEAAVSPPAGPAPRPGCDNRGVGQLRLVSQDYLPQDSETENRVNNLVPSVLTTWEAPTDAASFARIQEPGRDAYRLAVKMDGVRSLSFEDRTPAPELSRVDVSLQRDAPGPLAVTTGQGTVGGEGERRLSLSGVVPVLPASAALALSRRTEATPGATRTRYDVLNSTPGHVDLDLRSLDHTLVPPGGTAPSTELHVTGSLRGLPRHSRLDLTEASRPTGDQTVQGVVVEFCPDLSDAEWADLASPEPCSSKETSPEQVTLQAANFVAGDPDERRIVEMEELPAAAAERPYARYAERSALSSDPRDLFRASLSLVHPRRAAFLRPVVGEPEAGDARVEMDLSLDELHAATVVAGVDSRELMGDGEAKGGARIRAGAFLSPVPHRLHVAYETRPSAGKTLEAAYTIGDHTPVHLQDGRAAVDLGLDQRTVTARFTNTRSPLGLITAMVPEAMSLQIFEQVAAARVRRIEYRASQESGLEVGARMQTQADRLAGTATDLRAAFALPGGPSSDPRQSGASPAATVEWVEDVGASGPGALRAIDARLCPAATPCTNDWHMQVTRGPVSNADDLLEFRGEALPSAPVNWRTLQGVGNAFKAARSFLHYVGGADRWAITARLRDTARLTYQGAPHRACLSHRPATDGAPDDLGIGVFETTAFGAVHVDTSLTAFPENVAVRADPAAGATGPDGPPVLWVNTESCSVDDPADPAAGRIESHRRTGGPELKGTLRAGTSPEALLRAVALDRDNILGVHALHSHPARLGAYVDRTTTPAGGDWGVNATARIYLPWHVQLWAPATARCGPASETTIPPACDSSLHYEPDARRDVDVRYQSTSRNLGRLDAIAHVVDERSPDDRDDVRVLAGVVDVPGRLRTRVSLGRNNRLPLTFATLDVDARHAPGSVVVEAFDLTQPALRGDPWNRAGVSRSTIEANTVPKYRLSLRGLGTRLRVVGDLLSTETPGAAGLPATRGAECRRNHVWSEGIFGRNTGTMRGVEVRPEEPHLAYLHLDANLMGASHIDLSTRTAPDEDPGRYFGPARPSTLVLRSDRRLWATTRLRFDNIVAEYADDDTWYQVFACLDFDLPLEVAMTRVSDARVAQDGARVVLDVATADVAAGAKVTGTVGETFACEVRCPGGRPAVVTRRGAPFWWHRVRFDPTGPGEFRANYDRAWKRIGILKGSGWGACPYPYLDCVTSMDTFSFQTFRIDPRASGYESADVFLDVLFDEADRREMADVDIDHPTGEHPGRDFYKAIRQTMFPPLTFGPVSVAAISRIGTTFDYTPGLPMDAGGYCRLDAPDRFEKDDQRLPGSPIALGSDGTAFRLEVTKRCNGSRPEAVPVLAARHPAGQVRWRRHLLDNTGPRRAALPIAPGGEPWQLSIVPHEDCPDAGTCPPGLHADGSVTVHLIYEVVTCEVPASNRRDCLSGRRSGFPNETCGRIVDVNRTSVRRCVQPRVQQAVFDAGGEGLVRDMLGPLGSEHVPVKRRVEVRVGEAARFHLCNEHGDVRTCPIQPGVTRRWFLGDGTVVENASTRPVTHVFNRPGRYLVHAVEIDSDGRQGAPVGVDVYLFSVDVRP